MLGTLTKQPAEYLDYDINFEEWLTEDDSVAAASSSVSPTDELTIVDTLISGPIIKLWISGGTNGKTYKITVTATTALGRIKETEFRIRVRDY